MTRSADPSSHPEDPPEGSFPVLDFSTRSARRLHGDIANQLGKAIVQGDHAPGDILAGEIEFAERARVSRTAYREALRMLSAKGMVESRPKVGTRVTPRGRWNLLDPDVVRWFIEDGQPPEFFVRGLFELRLMVEPAAARLAAERRDSEDIEAISTAFAAMKSHTLAVPAGREADRRFHMAILGATGNEVLMSLGSGIGAAVNWTTHFKFSQHQLPRDPMDDHERVLAAILEADPAAAESTMRQLVELALNDIHQTMAD